MYTRTKKIFLGILLLSCATIFFVAGYIKQELDYYLQDLPATLTKKFGYPISIEEIHTSWSWGTLKVAVTGIEIEDQDTKVPLFAADKIVGHLDMLGSLYNLQPKFSSFSLVRPRLVLDWDGDGALTILGLAGEHIPGVIDPAILVQLLAIQNKINITEGDFHLQGRGGADLPFMHVQLEFRQKSNKHYTLVARGAIAAALPPEFNFAINYHGDLSDYREALIDFDLRTSFIQIKDFLKFTPQIEHSFAHGSFTDFDLNGVMQNGRIRYINSEFQVEKLKHIDYEISSGRGKISYSPTKENFILDIDDLYVEFANFYSHPLHIDKIQGSIDKHAVGEDWILETKDLQVLANGIKLNPQVNLNLVDQKINSLMFACAPQVASIPTVIGYLPDKIFSKTFYQWLVDSLRAGRVTNVVAKYNQQDLALDIDFVDTVLQYSASWPSIDNMHAHLSIKNHDLLITASAASVLGFPLNNVKTEFKITPRPYGPVKITGDVDASLQDGIRYLQQTPLKVKLADKLAKYDPKGKMHLDLALDVTPSGQEETKVKVAGDLIVNKATLDLPDIDIPLDNIAGKIQFSNDWVLAESLDLNIMGHKATASVKLADDDSDQLQVDFNSPIDVKDIKRLFPGLYDLRISGMTKMSGKIQIPWHATDSHQVLYVSSDMAGIAIDYPEPFAKQDTEVLPLMVEYHIDSNPINMINIDIPKHMSASLFVRFGEFYGAQVKLGNHRASRKVVDSLIVGGELQNFAWESWKDILQAGDRQNLVPVDLDLLVDNILLGDTTFKNTKVVYDSIKNIWQVDNEIISGRLSFSDTKDKVDINLQHLHLALDGKNSNNWLQHVHARFAEDRLPFVHLACENFSFKGNKYRNLSLQLTPRTYGYEIGEFSVANDYSLLQSQGQWQMSSEHNFTQLSGNVYTRNFGSILRDWQFGNSITRGAGEVNFSLQWPGDPTAFNYLQLEGASHIDLRSGALTDIKPGIGRVIGLLNIDSIQRRLQLDFSDITESGLSFDKLVADMKFTPGNVDTNNLMLNGPSARIELDGNLDLNSQQLDLTIFVSPKTGVGIPVAAAIAVNPAVGAALWLVDKAAGSKISEITKHKYSVTGTLDKPQIEEIITQSRGQQASAGP